KKRKRGGGEKEEVIEENLEKEEDEKEKKNKKRYQKKKFVSRPLMDTLWAMFKFKKNPTFQDISSLALEFSMTATQINRWFCKKRKIYKKEIYWRAYKNR
ncbi:NANOG neighbor homeobox, partial [Bos mutus]